jgi:xylulokinase
VVVRAVGGGARSALWGRIKADVLGVLPTAPGATGGRCARLRAPRRQAVGLLDDAASAAERFNELRPGVDPDAHAAAAYAPLLAAYPTLLDATAALTRARAAGRGDR